MFCNKVYAFLLVFIGVFSLNAQLPTDVPLELRAQFNGQYDYKIIGNTLNEFDNWQTPPPPCQMLTQSSAQLNLNAGQNIVAAYLYWSGIGDGTLNPIIQLNGNDIEADVINVVDPQQSGIGLYFGSFADVSNLVIQEGLGTYQFSGLDLNLGSLLSIYCSTSEFYSGWSLLVVYEDNGLPTQQVNIYDGFASVYGNGDNFSTSINIQSLNVVNTQDARMGYLAWNGSPNLFLNESISFNGNLLSNPPLNPIDNPFNGTNSYTGANDLYNMDLDAFDVSNYIDIGDTNAIINFTSLFNRFIQNVVTVTRSELPDATVELDDITDIQACDDRDITLEVNVNNFDSSKDLPANTPVAVHVLDQNDEEVFLDTFFTQNVIPIDGSESLSLDISIPDDVPVDTALILKVNTLQDSSNPINESDLLNNTIEQDLILPYTPEISIPPSDLSICSFPFDDPPIDLTQNDLTTLGLDDPDVLNIQYFTSNSDAQNANNAIPDPENFVLSSDPQDIFIRIENTVAPACFTTDSFTVAYADTPEIQQTINLHQCQQDDTPITFDLTTNDATAIGVDDPANANISYHETLTEAQNDVGPIPAPENYQPLNDSQSIYIRAENAENPECSSTASFEIKTFQAIIGQLSDLEQDACLSLGDTAVFDLTQNEDLALDGQDPQDFNISYHLNESDALSGVNAIGSPGVFETSNNSQEIWLRLVNTSASVSCSSVASFQLQVQPIAIINNVNDLNIQACIFPGGSASFDLTENTAIALGDQDPADFDITYHLNATDAQNGNNAITDPTDYDNLSDPQDIWLRLQNNVVPFECFSTEQFSISVANAAPINFSPDPLLVCDADNDGFADFDLTQSISDISLNDPDIDVTFHLSLSDAENNTDPLSSPFTNTIADEQILYFRTEEAGNGCSFTGSLDLEVFATPELDASQPTLSACSVNADTATFNLTDIDEQIILNDDTTNFDSDYYLSESDALSDTNAIQDPTNYTNTSDPQTLWIRISDEDNCSSVAAFQLDVLTGAALTEDPPGSLEVCSQQPDALFAQVDLSQLDSAINANPDAPTLVEYFPSLMAVDNEDPIQAPDNFEVNGVSTTVFARVVQVETLCVSEVLPIELIINPLPQVDLSAYDGQVICIDAASGEVIVNDFSPPIIDTGLSEAEFDFSWQRNGEALSTDTSSLTVDQPGDYQLVATNIDTGCQFSSTASIEESSIPDFEVQVISPPFSRKPIVEVRSISGSGSFEFRLDDGNWVGLSDNESLRFTDFEFGQHRISGRDQLGCGIRIKDFQVIGYRSFFTPNQDGHNDRWNIPSLKDQHNAQILIYDRYGKLLKQLRPGETGWDGTYNGNPMPSNDYWFSVEYTDPRTGELSVFRGNITLKR